MNTRLLIFIASSLACLFTGCGVRTNAPSRIVALENPYFADAEVAYLQGDYARAIQAYRAYLSQKGNYATYSSDAYLWIGKCQITLGNFSEASNAFQLGARNPRNTVIHAGCLEGLGDCQRTAGLFYDAVLSYKQALDVDTGNTDLGALHFKLGLAYQRDGKWANGRVQFRKVTGEFPGHEYAPRAKALADYPYEFFSLQAGIYQNQEAAKATVKQAQTMNLVANIRSIEAGGQTQYCVLIGRYVNYNEATRNLPAVRKFFKDAFITP